MTREPGAEHGADVIDSILAGDDGPAQQQLVEKQKDAARETLAVARDVAAVLGGPAGTHVMAWLRRCTVDLPAFVPGVQGQQYVGLDAVHQGFLREGQNSIYRELERLRDLGNNPPQELLAVLDGEA